MYELCGMANNLRGDINITRAGRQILSILCDRANTEGLCFPGLGYLAERAGCSPRTVIRAIKSLEEHSFIRVIRKRNKVNHYFVNITLIERSTKSGVTFCHPDVTFCPPRGDILSPDPISNTKRDTISFLGAKTQRAFVAEQNRSNTPMTTTLESIMKAKKDGKPIGGLKQKKQMSPSVQWAKALTRWREDRGLPSSMAKLTKLETNKLAQFKKRCTDEPPNAVILRCVTEWAHFAKYVYTAEGLEKYPQNPSIGFLLVYVQHAQDYSAGKTFDDTVSNKVTFKKKKVKPQKSNTTLDRIKAIEEGNW